jgi:hypothetical protein
VRTAGIADLFVAVIGNQPGDAPGQRPRQRPRQRQGAAR